MELFEFKILCVSSPIFVGRTFNLIRQRIAREFDVEFVRRIADVEYLSGPLIQVACRGADRGIMAP